MRSMGEDELFAVVLRDLEVRLRGLTRNNLAGEFLESCPGDDSLAGSIPANRGGPSRFCGASCWRGPAGLCDRPRNIAAQALDRDYRGIGRHTGSGTGGSCVFIARGATGLALGTHQPQAQRRKEDQTQTALL